MSDSIAGPCVICGATDYELSLGGPTICPSCDCGRDPEIGKLISLGRKQAVEITGLRAENAVLRKSLTRKGKSTFLEFVSLREKLATVTSEKMRAITELVTYEAQLKETQHVYAKTCGRLETERDDLKIALITANERLAAAEKDAERYRERRYEAYLEWREYVHNVAPAGSHIPTESEWMKDYDDETDAPIDAAKGE